MLRFLSFLLVFLSPLTAKADYFVWQDEKSGLSVTFPDTWKMQNNVHPDTVLTVMGASPNDQPVCRIDVREDKRYTIFPPRYGDAVQEVAVSTPFWNRYLQQYDSYNIENVYDNAGLGRWHASYALASYTRRFGSVIQQRRAIMFASLYNDTMFMIECSALNDGYERWALDFQSVIKSVDFEKAYHEIPTGDYANFLEDVDQLFWAQTGPDGTVIY